MSVRAQTGRRQGMSAILAFLLAALCATAHAAGAEPPAVRPQVERLAADVAAELLRLCPPAQPGDQAAFDRCRQGLFQESALRQSLSERVLWGRRRGDPPASIKETPLTQFAPDVLTGLYIPLFMFNGRHT